MFPFRSQLPPPPPPTEEELASQREHKAASDAYVLAVRARQQERLDAIARAEQERQDRDRGAAAERNRRRAEQHAALQAAQMAWGEKRRELQRAVDELKAHVGGLQGQVDHGELDDAVRAASELVVYRRRLELAEAELAQFVKTAPA